MIYQDFINESLKFSWRNIAGLNVEIIENMDGALM